MKKYILYTVMLLSCIQVYGQRRCGSQLNLIELQQTDPARYQRFMELESRIQEFLNTPVALRSLQQSETIYIPVVVHIVHNTAAQNISDAQIRSQIDVLNEDFNRLNVDRTRTPNEFAHLAGNANIRFMLATRDPFGNPTNGITRTFTNRTSFLMENDSIKFFGKGGQDAWNPRRFLNVWVGNLAGNLLGYAQFPCGLLTNTNTDGIVVHYRAFGRIGNLKPQYNRGRTATHEVGHWLNLLHIWGDAHNCAATDWVTDTPNQFRETEGCPEFPKTDACSPSFPGIMFMNFMDYTDDACMNMFTNGQVARMRAVFVVQRSEMLRYSQSHSSGNCGSLCPLCPPPSTPSNVRIIGRSDNNVRGDSVVVNVEVVVNNTTDISEQAIIHLFVNRVPFEDNDSPPGGATHMCSDSEINCRFFYRNRVVPFGIRDFSSIRARHTFTLPVFTELGRYRATVRVRLMSNVLQGNHHDYIGLFYVYVISLCYKHHLVNQPNDPALFQSGAGLGIGTVEINNVRLNDGNRRVVKAYNRVTIGPNTSISGNFSVQFVLCPELANISNFNVYSCKEENEEDDVTENYSVQ